MDKLQELLRASLYIFGCYGYKKATMEEIAAQLDMTKSALYLYIRNKRELYEKTVARALERWQSRVDEAVKKETDPLGKLRALAYNAFFYLAEDEDLRNVLARDPDIFPMFPAEDPYFEINERSRNMIKEILEEGMSQGVFREVQVENTVWLLFSLYKMFIIETYIYTGKESTLDLFKHTVELVTHGLLIKN
ncbi:MAG: TetR/AcrR family transcriptional regulator [Firmicutes bacterium]|nr:TetR/AcrR family transcriptional regulator [Bacillota bacterium]